jgi:hypothetical protein
MFKFLDENSKISSLRLTLFLGTLCICLMCVGTTIYLLYSAYKCKQVDWGGISMFLGAISAFTGTLLYGKVQQKKVEVRSSENP